MRRFILILTQPLATTPLRIGVTLLFFGWCAAMLGYHAGWKHGSIHYQPPQPTALERFFTHPTTETPHHDSDRQMVVRQ